jgi:hypothetical protein
MNSDTSPRSPTGGNDGIGDTDGIDDNGDISFESFDLFLNDAALLCLII